MAFSFSWLPRIGTWFLKLAMGPEFLRKHLVTYHSHSMSRHQCRRLAQRRWLHPHWMRLFTLTEVQLSNQFTFHNNPSVILMITFSVAARKRGRPLYVNWLVEFSGTSTRRNSGAVWKSRCGKQNIACSQRQMYTCIHHAVIHYEHTTCK